LANIPFLAPLNGIPVPPVRFAPAQVAALTGGLGTNGGARPPSNNSGQGRSQGSGQGGNQGNGQAGSQGNGQGGAGGGNRTGGGGTGGGAGPIGGGGAPIGGGQIAALSGQNIGAGGAGANVVGQFAGAQNQANQQQANAAQLATEFANTAITTFDQLRSIQTGFATFDATGIALTHASGPNTNSGGSFDASLLVDFGAQTLHFVVFNVFYFFNGGANQSFNYDSGAGGPGDSYASDTGFATGSDDSASKPEFFPTAPTDGATATVSGALLNDVQNGVIAAGAAVTVKVDNGTDVITGGVTVPANTGAGSGGGGGD